MLANFFDKDIAKVDDSSTMPLIIRVCSLYQKGTKLNEIAKVTGTHRQQVKRILQKGLKWFVDNYGVEEDKTVYPEETGVLDEKPSNYAFFSVTCHVRKREGTIR